MRQQLVKNLLFVLVVNVVVKTVWIFFIDRNVQIKVGYASYGTYQALFNLSYIFMVLLDFGLAQYTSRNVAANPRHLRVLFSSMLWTRIILSLVYGIVVFAIAWLLGYRSGQLILLSGVVCIQAFNSMLVFLRSNVAALQHFRTDGVLAVIDRLLMIIVCGTLLSLPYWSGRFKVEWFVLSQVVCYAAALVIAFIVLMRLSPVPVHFSLRPKMIRKVISESAPYALLMFLMSVYMRADSVMIERLGGAAGKVQAGIYASAFRLLDVANIFGIMFSGILLPMFSKMLAQKEGIASLVKTAVNIMMPVAFTVAVVALFFGQEIMLTLYHKNTGGLDAHIFSVLMWSFPPYCLMYIYSTALTANGSIHLLNRISVGIVALNLLLHTVLINRYQALGASFSVLATEWCVAGIVIFYAHRIFHLPHHIRWQLSHLGFVACLLLVTYAVRQLGLDWRVQLLIVLCIAFVLLVSFRFWSLRDIKMLFSRKGRV